MKLIYTATKGAVKPGDLVTLRDGVHEVASIEPPRHGGSTGRVYVRPTDVTGPQEQRGYYPSVIGAEWIGRQDQQD